jgi:hypothetical protein
MAIRSERHRRHSTVVGVKEGISQGWIMIHAPDRIYSRFTDCGSDDGVAGGQAYRLRRR